MPAARGLLLSLVMSRSDDERAVRDESTLDLLGGVLTDAADLVAAHGERIKLEVRVEVRALQQTIIVTGIAIATVVLAGLMLAEAAALGLTAATGLPLWLGHAALGVALAITGAVLYRQRAPSVDLVPSDAIAEVKRDVARIATAATR
ncbi:MAG: phage holin family protein [Deltaproteobacteria bacterium]|nr:phage holin family protein [Deltaproteobacteria bacterium]